MKHYPEGCIRNCLLKPKSSDRCSRKPANYPYGCTRYCDLKHGKGLGNIVIDRFATKRVHRGRWIG